MERVPKGWLAVGVLVVLTCGLLLWQATSTSLSWLSAEATAPPVAQELPAPADPSAEAPSRGDSLPKSDVIVVHVAGAVKQPGIVRIPRGSRVDDAVKAAGGFSDQADPDSVNLARPLDDGMQVYVPRKGEWVEVEGRVGIADKTSASRPNRAGSDGHLVGKININTADAEQMESLPGIGSVTARAIIEYRKRNGGFRSVEELLEVRGIGEKRLEQIRPFVVVR